MKSCKFLFLIVVTLCSVDGVEIHCKYSNHEYFTVGRSYTCAVEQKRDALWADSEVIKVFGDHHEKKNDSSVIAVRVHMRVMHTFPSNFEKFFQNLKVIQVYQSKLKVITQRDLQPFVKLQHIDLSKNDLESLEKELFKYNIELLVIKISENKLKFIDATAFDTLYKLHTLELNQNHCIWRSTESRDSFDSQELEELTREEVIDVMFEVRTRCYRDSILRELHEMEMGKFLKERSEIVVNLETKISELQEENDSFYKKMQQYKEELDVCKMEEIRKIKVNGEESGMMMMEDGPKGMNGDGKGNGNSNGHRGPLVGLTGSAGLVSNSQNFNGYPEGPSRTPQNDRFGPSSSDYDRNYNNGYSGDSRRPNGGFNEPSRPYEEPPRAERLYGGSERPNGPGNSFGGPDRPNGGYSGSQNSYESPNNYNSYAERPSGPPSSYPGNSYSNELPMAGGLNGKPMIDQVPGMSNQTFDDADRHPGGGPNSYLPLNREMMKNMPSSPPKTGIPIITEITASDMKNSRDYLPRNDPNSLQPPYENGYREQRYDSRSNRIEVEQPPAYNYRSQAQNYGHNWGKRDRGNDYRNYY